MYIKSLSPQTVVTSALVLFLLGLFLIANLPQAQAFTAFSNQKIKVTWKSDGVRNGTCTRTGGPGGYTWGIGTGAGSFTYPADVFSATPHTFTYTCTGATGSNFEDRPVYVTKTLYINTAALARNVDLQFSTSATNPLKLNPSLSFTNSDTDNSILAYQNFTLSWNYSDLYGYCRANWGVLGTNLPVKGSVILTNTNATYNDVIRKHEITCYSGDGGSKTTFKDLTFKELPAPIYNDNEEQCGYGTGRACN